MELPPGFRDKFRRIWGEPGASWLDGLPQLLAEAAGRWQLRLGPPFELSFSYVAPARRADGSRAVLKAGFPDAEFRSAVAALRLFDGRGAVRLLDADGERGLMLLERLEPGTTLAEVGDDDSTRIAAEVMRRLWRAVPAEHSFPSVAGWLLAFERHRQAYGGPGPLDRALFERAESLASDLVASSPEAMVLHGDLHHWNVLAAQRESWLAIDPKGVTGDPAFEAGAWLRNPRPMPAKVLRRRIAILSDELGYERERLKAWGVVVSVLSATWSAEDKGTGWEAAMEVAGQLATMR